MLRIIPREATRRLAWRRDAAACSARPDELVLALVALDQGCVDGSREGRVVELQREVFGSGLAGGSAPPCAELDAVGRDPVVGRLVVVAVAGLDAGLDADGEGFDRSAVGAGLVAGEGADLCHVVSPGLFCEAAQCGLDGGRRATGWPACTVRPERERRTAAAGLLGSRGRRGPRRGRRLAEPLRARGRTGARQAIREAVWALPKDSPGNDKADRRLAR